MEHDEIALSDLALVAQRMGVDVEERHAIGHATYNGDVCHTFDFETFDGAKGPNYMGEIMFPVTAEYDEETNQTRVGFSLMPPPPDTQVAWERDN